jgi:hypothetical protein
MQLDFVQMALQELRPNTPNWYGWAKVDAEGNKIPNDQRMCWEHAIVIQNGVTKPTKAEFDAKIAELKSSYAAKEYARKRQVEYPALGEQLDMLWHGIDSGTLDKDSDFYTTLKAVKDKYPKSAE